MTREEFSQTVSMRCGDEIVECNCGFSNCDGWKLYNRAEAERMADALERLPEILCAAAFEAGRRAAEEQNRRFFEAMGI